MIRNAFRSLSRRLLSHEKVGSDASGNHYLRQIRKDDAGDDRERRWVEFPREKGPHFYDANSMPPEWHQWLNHGRAEPPSEQHILEAEAARDSIRQKAAAIDDAAFGQRLRAQAYGVNESTASSPEGAVKPQLTDSAAEVTSPPEPATKPTPADSSHTQPSEHSEEVTSWVPPQR